MATLSDLSDKLFSGEHATSEPDHHPFAILDQIEEITGDVAFYKGFSNLAAVKTGEELILIDTGSFHPVANGRSHKKVRSWSPGRVHTAIYTHGHVDHAYGLPPFLKEAGEKGWARPNIIGHCNVPLRMTRYIETSGFNAAINLRQFNQPIEWPVDPIYPTQTYADRMELRIGDKRIELFHAKGETDDHTWAFLPDQRVLYTGDLFIWAVPNAGNPQKVQRYCIEWVRALRQMAGLRPEFLLPGHGVPVFGEQRVQDVLLDTAEYLEDLYRQTVGMMNEGARIDDIIHSVKPLARLGEKPYLQPVYDEPEFIVRNICRCLGGWYSGLPCELKPAPIGEQSREIAALAGGVAKLSDRASKLADEGNLAMACHLADWAVEAAPDDSAAHKIRARIYQMRAEAEPSTMSKGVFGDAARQSQKKLEPAKKG